MGVVGITETGAVASRRGIGLTLSAVPSSAGAARRLVTQALPRWGMDEHIDTASLIISELFTNALRAVSVPADRNVNPFENIKEKIEVRLWVDDVGSLVLGVTDSNPEPPMVKVAMPDDDSGRGMRLVE